MATNFEGMTKDEIAGHFWDAQSTQIAEGSDYAGSAGRTKFIADYASSFQTYEDSGAKTILDLQDEMSGIQTAQAQTDLDYFVAQETGNIQLEEKWWNDEGWTDESGEYVESSVEMLTRQNDEMNDILDRTRQDEITTIVKDFTETKESAQFKQQRTGVNVHQGADELRATLWSEVEGVKDKYSDAKENSQKDLDRTVKDNRLNITRGYEDIDEGTEKRKLRAAQAGESEIVNNLGNKEEAMDGFGTDMWNTMRRLQNAGIFNEPIEDYVAPVEESSSSCFSGASHIILNSGQSIKIKDLNIGDKVKTINKNGIVEYSEVYAWLHKSNDKGYYLSINTEGTTKALEISTEHLLMLNGKYRKAKYVKAGDIISDKKVLSVNTVEATGLYTPVTRNGRIVIDGINCSCYAEYSHGFSHFMVSMFLKPLVKLMPTIIPNWLDKRGINKFAVIVSRLIGNRAGI